MNAMTWLLGWILMAGAPAAHVEGLVLCPGGLAPRPGSPALAQDETLLPELEELPGLPPLLQPLRNKTCVPLDRILDQLLEPPQGAPTGAACRQPHSADQEAKRTERRLVSQSLVAWRDSEAVQRGLGAFSTLGDPAGFVSLSPQNPQAFAERAPSLFRRARTPATELEVLRLPVLARTEDLLIRAREAASKYVEFHESFRQAKRTEGQKRAAELSVELWQDALELVRLRAEIGGAEAELLGLDRLAAHLGGAPDPSAEALQAARARTADRLVLSLRSLVQRAREQAKRADGLCAALAFLRELQPGLLRPLAFPAAPVPEGFVPIEAMLLAAPEGGEARGRGVWLLIVQKQPEAVARSTPGKPRRPKRPTRSRMRLEEDGVERSEPGARAASGQPTPVDAAVAARQSHVQACSLGNASACYQAGLLVEAGSGGPSDMPAARRFFQQACDGGFELGCYQYGSYLMAGLGGAQDGIQGRALLQRACQAKIKQACRRLEMR